MGKKRRSDWTTFILAMLLLLSTALPWFLYGALCFSHKEAVAASAMDEPKLIALTFDDGPRRSTTTTLLDGLAQRGVHATFFLVGTNVEVNPELVLRMDQEGHQIGIHSYHHKMLTELNTADFYQEVDALRALIEGIIGHDSLVIRPPYGKVDSTVKRLAGAPIIQWSIDPEDWSDEDTARQVALIVSQAKDGDIILLHDIYPSSVETALQVVDILLAEGFYFVTIDELFAAKGIPLEKGQVYMNAHT